MAEMTEEQWSVLVSLHAQTLLKQETILKILAGQDYKGDPRAEAIMQVYHITDEQSPRWLEDQYFEVLAKETT